MEIGNIDIGISVIVAIVVTSLTFRYLVTTKKIKISKISNIFYEDDENFIKYWEKIQEKGKLKFILKIIIFTTVGSGIIGIVFILNKRRMYGYVQSQTLFVPLLMGAIIGLINSLLGWGKNQDRYSRLTEKRNEESDNT
ncbi:MAG: hypothetical protein ACREVX_14530 [Clostridium sp.]|uniref:hypothetical protein n=1 Tax=Clostridium sp. TaxID=1506 RepID=UPI003D6CE828